MSEYELVELPVLQMLCGDVKDSYGKPVFGVGLGWT
jgi:hypothetical protein